MTAFNIPDWCIFYSYAQNGVGKVGLYIAANPLTPEHSYFEVEILDTGIMGAIGKWAFKFYISIHYLYLLIINSWL